MLGALFVSCSLHPAAALESIHDGDAAALLPRQQIEHVQPKALPACATAITNSRQQIDLIASKLGVENKLSDIWESQLLFRQAQGLRMTNGRELVYYIQPNSAHSTIHNHLLAVGSFDNGMDRWDQSHPGTPNEQMHQQGRSTEASQALAQVMERESPPVRAWGVGTTRLQTRASAPQTLGPCCVSGS